MLAVISNSVIFADVYTLVISAVQNNSEKDLVVQRVKIVCQQIKSGTHIAIPFVSSDKYHVEIIQDKPYFPSAALKVGDWGIWEEERGIMCALAPDKQGPREHKIPLALMQRTFNIQDPAAKRVTKAVRFLLAIRDYDRFSLPMSLKILSEA